MVDNVSSLAGTSAVLSNRQVDTRTAPARTGVSDGDVKLEERIDFKALSEAVAKVQKFADVVSGRALSFTVDTQLNRSVITVKDASTQSLVRQIPSEEFLEVARALQEQQVASEQARTIRGLIFDSNI